MILELFEDRSLFIFYIKSDKQFKVNANHLKPYLTLEPTTSTDKVNLHILEGPEDVTSVSPSPH